MKLLDQVRQVLRVRHYSYRTEQCYVGWIAHYLRFCKGRFCKGDGGWKHPRERKRGHRRFAYVNLRCPLFTPIQG